MLEFDIPLILRVQADERPEAIDLAREFAAKATGLMDRVNGCEPITDGDHRVAKMLGLSPEGREPRE